ncbi:hypothetical protein HOJ01_03895 [bacterium]|jgi:hypothetical protein|nr:hypothetical protein [bacterium]MBT6293922.1 hypothetical protein [bacterium]
MPDPINPQGINQGGQNINRAQNPEQQAGIEEHTNKIIADLEQDIVETGISGITKTIQEKATNYTEKMKGMAKNFEEDPDSMTQEFINRMNHCEESLLELQELSHEAVKIERILIQNLFGSFESMPDAFNKFASRNTINGSLEIKPDGESLLSKMEDFMQLRQDALEYVQNNPDSVTFDLETLDPTEDNWLEVTQAFLSANPNKQNITLEEILSSFDIQDPQTVGVIKQSLLDYEEGSQETFNALLDANEDFINDINMLNQGEAYNRVLTQEKIKLSKKLGVRVETGNQFHIVDNNGNSKTLVIRGIHFQSHTPYFDKQRDLELTCDIVDSSTDNEITDERSNVLNILENSLDGALTCIVDSDLLENFAVYPKCDSFAELEERLGFRSMDQTLQPGTLFSYRMNKTSPEKHFTEVRAFDFENNLVALSEPIPTNELDGQAFNSALENKDTDSRLQEFKVQLGDGTIAYEYHLEDFLNFSYKYQAEEDLEAEMNEKTESLTSQELDRRLKVHHDFMLKNGLAVSKKPIEIHAGNALANLKGDKYEIKSVSGDSIILENLSYPKYDGDNPDPEATMEFNLPELLKFIKDQNLGMISKEKIKNEWSPNLRPIRSMDMPDWEWPEVPFGLMSMNDIVDISKIFGEQVSQKRQRKRDLRKAKFQSALGQGRESLEAQNKAFNERVDFHKERYQEAGNSNTWNKELKKVGKANFRNPENKAKFKALIDILTEEGSLSALDEEFISILNKARRQTRGVVTDPIRKKTRYDDKGELLGEDWVDRDGTRNEDAVAEALNYIFNNNGQPSNFGTQCMSKNRSAFTSSMNEAKNKTDRLGKEGQLNFEAEFSKLFTNLGSGKPMDAGQYTGILQSMVDGGLADLETFFYYLYAGLSHEINGNGPILDDQFIESLNYGDHPFFHAFTVHKNLLIGKKDEIWSGFSGGKNSLPTFKNNNQAKAKVQEFLWGYMLPLSKNSTKKHLKTAEAKNYAKEYPGFVLSKLSHADIEDLFSVGDLYATKLSFNGPNYEKHKDAFGQYAAGFKYAANFAENHERENDGIYIRNLLTSGIALYGLTHARYKTHKKDDNGNVVKDNKAKFRSFPDDKIKELALKSGMIDFKDTLKKIADKAGVNVNVFLDGSTEQHYDNQKSEQQAEQFITKIKSLSPKDLAELVKGL